MPYDHVDNFFGFPMQAQNCFSFGGILPFCLPVYLNQQLLLHHFFFHCYSKLQVIGVAHAKISG